MLIQESITSLQNAQVKRLVRLRTRRERQAEGLWLIEGARELGRALASGLVFQTLYHCPELFSDEARELMPTLEALPLAAVRCTREVFEKVSHRENPDGLLALTPPPSPALPLPTEHTLLLVLMGLEKPGNLGALLRTADGVGVDAVLVVGEGTDLGNPGVIRASQGSLFTQPVIALDEEQALTWLRAHAFTLVACTPEAALPYWDAPLTGRVALCLGSEHDGLPAAWRDAADLGVAIPMRGQADSLNVSVAGALVLYEARRQRASERGRP
ncbi:RNA methyltransferase [Deinococcus sp. KNUC1210]|uniref:TrmH family RNA methyltransferase n=1 Tax=Deinococcus sp. KNUC1210 TaxID=2917691 RepID=UPI001EF12B15|nr:RNA methyltransferase [Deinococcus sp. KNUC1210]ULH15908.1 RNA methyltransferase [Deinococcus sp. KNUC1210]